MLSAPSRRNSSASCQLSTPPTQGEGDPSDPYAGGHEWNQVYVDGQWKVVDVTWNDGDQPGGKQGSDDTRLLLVDHHPREGAYFVGASKIEWIVDNIYSAADFYRVYQ